MASYKSPLQSFNPYISESNADLYGQVIMTRQGQYDQGVERIQNYIDNDLKLQVARPEDQRYLQQRISEMKSSFEGLGSADFGDRNVLRQATKIAAQIGKDRRIQKDVISAANYSDAQRQLQEAQKKGTLAKENAFQVQKQIASWQQGGEDASLGKVNYTPYDDFNPRWTAFMKEVHPHVVIDQTVPKDENGNPQAYVIQNNERKYLSQSEVQGYFQDFLSLDRKAAQQVGINADYHANTMSDEEGLVIFTKGLQNKLQQGQLDLKSLQQNKALYAKTAEDKANYDAKIKSLSENISSLESQYQNAEQQYRDNPLGIKSQMYVNSLTAAAARRFVVNDTQSKLDIDPRAEFQLKLQAEQRLQNKDARDAQKDALEIQKLQSELNGTAESSVNVMVPALTTSKEEYGAVQLENDLKTEEQQIQAQSADLLFKVLPQSVTSEYLRRGEDGIVRITNPSKAQAALNEISQSYQNGYLQGKPQYIIDLLKNYYEGGNPDYGANLINQHKIRKDDWESTKVKDYASRGRDFFKAQKVDPKAVIARESFNQYGGSQPTLVVDITNQDLFDYQNGILKDPAKLAAIEKNKQTYSEKGDLSYTKSLEFKLDAWKKTYDKEFGNDDLARKFKDARSLPSYNLQEGTDKDANDIVRKNIGLLVTVASSQAQAGGASGNQEKFIKYAQGIANESKDGANKIQPVINISKENGKYYAKVANAYRPEKTKIELPESVVNRVAKELTAPPVVGVYQNEIRYNNKKTGQAESNIHTRNLPSGYTMKFKFVEANGLYYPVFSYKKAGTESAFVELDGLSKGLPDLTTANAYVNTVLNQNKEQLEDTISQYHK